MQKIKPGKVRYASTAFLMKQYNLHKEELASIEDEILEHPDRVIELQQKKEDILKEIFIPEIEFEYEGFTEIDGVKCWFASSAKNTIMTVGPKDFMLSNPTGIIFQGDNVHSLAEGKTGCGKSVLIHDMLNNISDDYPPWEVRIIYIDPKNSEGHFYTDIAPSPHFDVISCTGSIEFNASLFEYLKKENHVRQTLYSVGGTSNIPKLRAKYNLVIPSLILVFDEYLESKRQIEDTRVLGNKDAEKTLSAQEDSLVAIATLGRSAEIHEYICSQELNKGLKSETTSQMDCGIIMQGSVEMSEHAIGNPEGNKLDRRGICLINNFRNMKHNEQHNIVSGIPFLEMDAESKQGEYTLSQRLLYERFKKSQELNLNFKPSSFNEKMKVPRRRYREELSNCLRNSESDETCMAQIPIGESISFTNSNPVSIPLFYRLNENIVYDSRTKEAKHYLEQIIFEYTRKMFEAKPRINTFGTASLNESYFKNIDSKDIDIYNVSTLKESIPKAFYNRSLVYGILKNLENSPSKFDKSNTFLTCLLNLAGDEELVKKISNKHILLEYLCNNEIEKEKLQEFSDSEIHDLLDAKGLFEVVFNYINDFDLDKGAEVQPSIFDTQFVFWLELADAEDKEDFKVMNDFTEYLERSPSLGIVNVVYSSRWRSIRSLSKYFKWCLDYSKSDFYDEFGFSKFYCNSNLNSITVTDLVKGVNSVVKIYTI